MDFAPTNSPLKVSPNVSAVASHQQLSIHVFPSPTFIFIQEITTFSFTETGTHDSKCGCCRATDYDSLDVELECEDGFTYKKTVAVPKVCGCEDGYCPGLEPEPQKRSYKSAVKTYNRKIG